MLSQAYYRLICLNVVIVLPSPKQDMKIIWQSVQYTLISCIIWASTASK